MATTINSLLTFGMQTTEDLDTTTVAPGSKVPEIVHNAFDQRFTLNATSDVPVSLISEQQISLSASGTIDFTALPTTQGSRTAVPLKLRAVRIVNNGAHVFSLAVGASNGYVIGGAAIKVQPFKTSIPGVAQMIFNDALTVSDATHKTLDYTYDVSDAGLVQITLLFG